MAQATEETVLQYAEAVTEHMAFSYMCIPYIGGGQYEVAQYVSKLHLRRWGIQPTDITSIINRIDADLNSSGLQAWFKHKAEKERFVSVEAIRDHCLSLRLKTIIKLERLDGAESGAP